MRLECNKQALRTISRRAAFGNGQWTVGFRGRCDALASDLIARFDKYGWFCSVHAFDEKAGRTRLCFEAKFQDTMSAEDLAGMYPKEYGRVIHVTPSFNRDKILRDGFEPRCRNMMFEYPGRTYFIPYVSTQSEIEMLIYQLWNKSGKSDRIDEYTIFTVDTSKCGVDFQVDYNCMMDTMDGTALPCIFTTENIRPGVILDSHPIRISDIESRYGLSRGEIDSMMSYTNLLKK